MTWPRWKWTKTTVTITLPIDVAVNLGDVLNEWAEFGSWTQREDCQNWTRSMTARENRRESIVYGNCLSSIKAYLGQDGAREAMERAKARANASSSPGLGPPPPRTDMGGTSS